MWNKNVETFIGCDAAFEEAATVIFGAPFDATTSYRPGTRFGSKAMRAESYGIETYSPYQDLDLEDYKIFDGGDLELPFGNVEKALSAIEAATKSILDAIKLPIMLGGEHLVTLGALRAAVKKYPDIHVIHLDAHADLRAEYLGEPLSHASVIRRAWDIIGDGKIFQFGIRSGEKAEFAFAKEHTFMQKFNLDGLADVIKKLQDKPVYFTLDLDVLDPAEFPGTGTPEAGGIRFMELLDAVQKIGTLNIVGCDLCELSPPYDQTGRSTALACKTLREILLAIGHKI